MLEQDIISRRTSYEFYCKFKSPTQAFHLYDEARETIFHLTGQTLRILWLSSLHQAAADVPPWPFVNCFHTHLQEEWCILIKTDAVK